MTREEAKAYIENLKAFADEIVELMRERGLTYYDANDVLKWAKEKLDYDIGRRKI